MVERPDQSRPNKKTKSLEEAREWTKQQEERTNSEIPKDSFLFTLTEKAIANFEDNSLKEDKILPDRGTGDVLQLYEHVISGLSQKFNVLIQKYSGDQDQKNTDQFWISLMQEFIPLMVNYEQDYATISEYYSGRISKAYNLLKDLLTSSTLTENKKELLNTTIDKFLPNM